MNKRRPQLIARMTFLCYLAWGQCAVTGQELSYASVVEQTQPRMVKIFGSGGLRGLESYQSGFLISDDGYLITAWSYVLDAGDVTVYLADGRKFSAVTVGIDPYAEIAVLKVPAEDLPHFRLADAVDLRAGCRVLAFGNVYGVATGDEDTSVLHGIVAGVTKLAARRGAFETPYRGDVYVLDAMTNNAGAAGGALTDSRGHLAAILGKELRDKQTGIWLNYATPVSQVRKRIQLILDGEILDTPDSDADLPTEFVQLQMLGIVPVPDVLRNTPPFIELVLPNSPAHRAGIRPDDLIVLVNGQSAPSQTRLRDLLRRIDVVDAVNLTVMRGTDLIQVTLRSP